MQITEYFSSAQKEHWLNEIRKSDWGAGQYLYELLVSGDFRRLCGADAKVLLLTEQDQLMAFCTFADQDDIDAPQMKPWVGFVYTFPQYRGKRRMGKLLEYAYSLAKQKGYEQIFISTGQTGLYEKYGYTFMTMMTDRGGDESRVYRCEVKLLRYDDILGKTVSGTVDRPLGSQHPKYPEMVYPINYGYVCGTIGGDGEAQDAYIFGTNEPIQSFTGQVTGVWHRLNDNEDKWIVAVNGVNSSREEILSSIDFQEQYFMGELITSGE